MDFLLKKFVSMFIMPLPLGLALILLGIYFLTKHNYTKAKYSLVLSILWLFLISYSPISDSLLSNLESKNPTLHHAPENVKYIYVLGGGHNTDEDRPITSQVVAASVIRLNEGIRHYHQLNGKAKIIVSGNHGLHDPTEHAVMQKRLAISLGVDKNDLILHLGTRDTEEEAQAGKQLLGSDPFILVTSASHMTRALKFFRNEGLSPIAAPTNHLSNSKYINYTDFFSAEALRKSHILWHEYLGLIWQKIKGI